jgi:hypothetical protein
LDIGIVARCKVDWGCRSVDDAFRTIQGYEAMNEIRKGQIRWLAKERWEGPAGSACRGNRAISRDVKFVDRPHALYFGLFQGLDGLRPFKFRTLGMCSGFLAGTSPTKLFIMITICLFRFGPKPAVVKCKGRGISRLMACPLSGAMED